MPVQTPDSRYIVVRGRLWRAANPNLTPTLRDANVSALMAARRAVRAAKQQDDPEKLAAARRVVDAAKHLLSERGPPWWSDGAPDENRRLVKNSSYSAWWLEVGQHLAPDA